MKIRCIDIETLGLTPDNPICEIGWCDVESCDHGAWSFGTPNSVLVNPEQPIPAIASAVHHIVDADVKDAPSLADALADSDVINDGIDLYVAHNSRFEQLFLPQIKKWGCTYRLAVTHAPLAPGHKLQELRHWLRLDLDRSIADQSHRAGPDAYVCAALLARMMANLALTPERVMEISAGPVVLPRLHFGMHAGKPCTEIPDGYWTWCLKQETMDPDVKHTAFHFLKLARSS